MIRTPQIARIIDPPDVCNIYIFCSLHPMQHSFVSWIIFKVAAVSNQERQNNKFIRCTNTSQTGNWHNFRNAEYNREVSRKRSHRPQSRRKTLTWRHRPPGCARLPSPTYMSKVEILLGTFCGDDCRFIVVVRRVLDFNSHSCTHWSFYR